MKLRWWTETRHFWPATDNTMSRTVTGEPGAHDWVGFNEIWNGTGIDETHNGTNADDTLNGMGGNDTLNGKKGNDTITGGLGNDTILGGDGNDTLHVGSGTDAVNAGKGDDLIIVDAAGGTLAAPDGGTGVDTLDASAVTGSWSVSGAINIEHFILTNGADSFGGLAGDEIYEGRNGDDRLFGGSGNDTLDGGNGFDLAVYSNSAAGVTANLATGKAKGEGNDTFTSIEGVLGSTHDDKLVGDRANNHFAGLEGNDQIDGAGGIDNVFYNSISSGSVIVNLALGTATGALGNDTLKDVENVIGSSGGDTITGNNVANVLFGDAGNDTVNGGGGNDFVYGNDGNDVLSGGDGGDVLEGGAGVDRFNFAFAAKTSPTQFITDHAFGETIDLSAIDAIRGGADQAFVIVQSFNGAPGEAIITYVPANNQTIIQLDTDGGATPTANYTIAVNGDVSSGADIIW